MDPPGHRGGIKQDDATVTVEEQYEQLTERVRRDVEHMHSGYYDEACSARILHVFDEMAFVVNLLRKYQKETTELREENQRLRDDLFLEKVRRERE